MVVYIVSHNFFTGGPESLHQLGQCLVNNNISVKICYLENEDTNSDRLKQYHIPSIISLSEIEDDNKNLLIVPEDSTEILEQFSKIKKCIWWLSWYYYLAKLDYTYVIQSIIPYFPKYLFFIPKLYKLLRYRKQKQPYIPKVDDGIYHLYNCEVVRQYLTNLGITTEKMHYLCGPIDDIYFSANKENNKENIVLYNPKKGYYFTKKLLFKLDKKNIQTIPIQNLSAQEICSLMSRAKLYIDFGFFPGPERIPREAVTRGCNIITSTSGCAANAIDIPIPDEYKYDTSKLSSVNKIVEKIQYMLQNYENEYINFETYRKKVLEQKNRFENDIHNIIEILSIA